MASQRTPTDLSGLNPETLRSLVDVPFDPSGLTAQQEAVWLDVIAKMEQVYTDLLEDEIELEEKNAALQDAQRFIDSVLSSMSDLLIVCDRKGKIRQVNSAVCELSFKSEDELLGGDVAGLIVDPEGDHLPFKLSQACEAEARLFTKDGLSDLLSLRCTARKDRRGRPSGNVITGRPIGELKRAYAALERAHSDLQQSQQRMIYAEKMASVGRLVAGVAHELNNPISFVYSNVHALTAYSKKIKAYLDEVHSGLAAHELAQLRKELGIDDVLDDLPDLIDGIQEGSERASNIVKGLRRMSFSGPETMTLIDVAELVSNALTWARRGSRINVGVKLSAGANLFVSGQESQLQQVALNIIQNAFDAMRETPAPALEINAYAQDHYVVIDFKDYGPGISDENLPKIFEPFFTTKDIGEGTGLGLWVSFDIIKAHGGDLSAQNHSDGGAMIRLTLPAATKSDLEQDQFDD